MASIPPATGKVKILSHWDGVSMTVEITPENGTAQVYDVFQGEHGFDLYTIKADERIVKYSLDCRGKHWSCTCPDATHRPERLHCCKHVRAVKAAIKVVPADW